jgi:hypothetical protein
MSRPSTPPCRTLNWPAYDKALKRRGSLTVWFDPDMAWAAEPAGKRGRQPVCSDAAVQTCLTMKLLFGMALRQTTEFVERLLRFVGLDWDVPDFSTLSRRQKTLAVNIPHRESQGPLHLLIDGSGIKVEGEGGWNARKHGDQDVPSAARSTSGSMRKHWRFGQSRSGDNSVRGWGQSNRKLICATESRRSLRRNGVRRARGGRGVEGPRHRGRCQGKAAGRSRRRPSPPPRSAPPPRR